MKNRKQYFKLWTQKRKHKCPLPAVTEKFALRLHHTPWFVVCRKLLSIQLNRLDEVLFRKHKHNINYRLHAKFVWVLTISLILFACYQLPRNFHQPQASQPHERPSPVTRAMYCTRADHWEATCLRLTVSLTVGSTQKHSSGAAITSYKWLYMSIWWICCNDVPSLNFSLSPPADMKNRFAIYGSTALTNRHCIFCTKFYSGASSVFINMSTKNGHTVAALAHPESPPKPPAAFILSLET